MSQVATLIGLFGGGVGGGGGGKEYGGVDRGRERREEVREKWIVGGKEETVRKDDGGRGEKTPNREEIEGEITGPSNPFYLTLQEARSSLSVTETAPKPIPNQLTEINGNFMPSGHARSGKVYPVTSNISSVAGEVTSDYKQVMSGYTTMTSRVNVPPVSSQSKSRHSQVSRSSREVSGKSQTIGKNQISSNQVSHEDNLSYQINGSTLDSCHVESKCEVSEKHEVPKCLMSPKNEMTRDKISKCQIAKTEVPGKGVSRPPLWQRARSSLKNIKSKCSSHCRHGGRWPPIPNGTTPQSSRSPSTCTSPTSSDFWSPGSTRSSRVTSPSNYTPITSPSMTRPPGTSSRPVTNYVTSFVSNTNCDNATSQVTSPITSPNSHITSPVTSPSMIHPPGTLPTDCVVSDCRDNISDSQIDDSTKDATVSPNSSSQTVENPKTNQINPLVNLITNHDPLKAATVINQSEMRQESAQSFPSDTGREQEGAQNLALNRILSNKSGQKRERPKSLSLNETVLKPKRQQSLPFTGPHVKLQRPQSLPLNETVTGTKRERPQFLPLGKTIIPDRKRSSCHPVRRPVQRSNSATPITSPVTWNSSMTGTVRRSNTITSVTKPVSRSSSISSLNAISPVNRGNGISSVTGTVRRSNNATPVTTPVSRSSSISSLNAISPVNRNSKSVIGTASQSSTTKPFRAPVTSSRSNNVTTVKFPVSRSNSSSAVIRSNRSTPIGTPVTTPVSKCSQLNSPDSGWGSSSGYSPVNPIRSPLSPIVKSPRNITGGGKVKDAKEIKGKGTSLEVLDRKDKDTKGKEASLELLDQKDTKGKGTSLEALDRKDKVTDTKGIGMSLDVLDKILECSNQLANQYSKPRQKPRPPLVSRHSDQYLCHSSSQKDSQHVTHRDTQEPLGQCSKKPSSTKPNQDSNQASLQHSNQPTSLHSNQLTALHSNQPTSPHSNQPTLPHSNQPSSLHSNQRGSDNKPSTDSSKHRNRPTNSSDIGSKSITKDIIDLKNDINAKNDIAKTGDGKFINGSRGGCPDVTPSLGKSVKSGSRFKNIINIVKSRRMSGGERKMRDGVGDVKKATRNSTDVKRSNCSSEVKKKGDIDKNTGAIDKAGDIDKNAGDIVKNTDYIDKSGESIDKNSGDTDNNGGNIVKNGEDIDKNDCDIENNAASIDKNCDNIDKNCDDMNKNTSDIDKNADTKMSHCDVTTKNSSISNNQPKMLGDVSKQGSHKEIDVLAADVKLLASLLDDVMGSKIRGCLGQRNNMTRSSIDIIRSTSDLRSVNEIRSKSFSSGINDFKCDVRRSASSCDIPQDSNKLNCPDISYTSCSNNFLCDVRIVSSSDIPQDSTKPNCLDVSNRASDESNSLICHDVKASSSDISDTASLGARSGFCDFIDGFDFTKKPDAFTIDPGSKLNECDINGKGDIKLISNGFDVTKKPNDVTIKSGTIQECDVINKVEVEKLISDVNNLYTSDIGSSVDDVSTDSFEVGEMFPVKSSSDFNFGNFTIQVNPSEVTHDKEVTDITTLMKVTDGGVKATNRANADIKATKTDAEIKVSSWIDEDVKVASGTDADNKVAKTDVDVKVASLIDEDAKVASRTNKVMKVPEISGLKEAEKGGNIQIGDDLKMAEGSMDATYSNDHKMTKLDVDKAFDSGHKLAGDLTVHDGSLIEKETIVDYKDPSKTKAIKFLTGDDSDTRMRECPAMLDNIKMTDHMKIENDDTNLIDLKPADHWTKLLDHECNQGNIGDLLMIELSEEDGESDLCEATDDLIQAEDMTIQHAGPGESRDQRYKQSLGKVGRRFASLDVDEEESECESRGMSMSRSWHAGLSRSLQHLHTTQVLQQIEDRLQECSNSNTDAVKFYLSSPNLQPCEDSDNPYGPMESLLTTPEPLEVEAAWKLQEASDTSDSEVETEVKSSRVRKQQDGHLLPPTVDCSHDGDVDSSGSSNVSSRCSSPALLPLRFGNESKRFCSETNVLAAWKKGPTKSGPDTRYSSAPSLAGCIRSGGKPKRTKRNNKLSGSTPTLQRDVQGTIARVLSAWSSLPRLHPLSKKPSQTKLQKQGRGWEALRRKVVQEKAWRHCEIPDICHDGGEDTSEWVEGRNTPNPVVSKHRPPRFSEIFKTASDVKAARKQLKASSMDCICGSTGSLSTQKDHHKPSRYNSKQHRSRQDTGPESGIGSSFEDTSGCVSRNNSNASQVVEAITHYLCTVDVAESEDDSFNHEADHIDPNDLLLLTDNDDVLSCHDFVLDPEPQDLKLDFSDSFTSTAESSKPRDNLNTLLDPHFPTSSLDWPVNPQPDSLTKSTSVSQTTQTIPSASITTTSASTHHTPIAEDITPVTETKEEAKIDAASQITSTDTAQITDNAQSKTTDTTQTATPTEDSRSRGLCKRSDCGACEEARERSVSCSDNMRAFLLSQPCATAHRDGINHDSCTDKHKLPIATESIEGNGNMEPSVGNENLEMPQEDKNKKSKKKLKKKKSSSRFYSSLPTTPSSSVPTKSSSTFSSPFTWRKGTFKSTQSQDATPTGFWARLFCTTPVTVEGLRDGQRDDHHSASSSHDSDPEPLPPPIPPHGVDPATITTTPPTTLAAQPAPTHSISPNTLNNNNVVGRVDPSPDNNNILSHTDAPVPPPVSPIPGPEFMTADEAQRLLSSKEGHGVLSDEEAQEVVLLLSPRSDPNVSAPCLPPPPSLTQDLEDSRYDSEPTFDSGFASETVTKYEQNSSFDPLHNFDPTPRFDPALASYDPSVEFDPAEKLDPPKYESGSAFDPTLASPFSPEDEPSEADSSEASGDITQVSRVKEVLVEDGVHYLEDGHFWVEVPGLAEEWDDEDEDPNLPYHPHTKLTFSTKPVQVFSTYSVTEYDRKNDEVDPVAASAEYELEKRVEKMDLFPVQILKGEGGLGLSIIGMGVGADAGVEKLGIFVKTITPSGATERDGRIQVNDQIIEVDGKSLVGVTQVFAASVLKNTSGEVNFLIGREKDPENSEVAQLIKQSLEADREREERRRALGGPDYDPHTGQALFDPMSSPSEENSRSEDSHHHHPHYPHYLEGTGQSPPTSPDGASPTPEAYDLEGDIDVSQENDVAALKKKLREVQYRHAVAESEVSKLKMSLEEMERKMGEGFAEGQGQIQEAVTRATDLDNRLAAKVAEASTYQDMLEQSQGQFIVLEKKYYKAKKIIKEYQARERDFLHREEYHITQLEDKDSHYNALVKALKDRVIQLEGELVKSQKKGGLPVQVPPTDPSHPTHWHPPEPHSTTKPPRKPSLCLLASDLSDTETSDPGTSEGKANTVERKLPVKEELDEAVPPHELLDVSASRAKGELAARGGLANRHAPSLKKTTSMSSAGSQDHSLDDSSLDDELPESQKHHGPAEVIKQEGQQDSRRSAGAGEQSLPSHLPPSSSVVSAKIAPQMHPSSHSQQHSSHSQPSHIPIPHPQPTQHPPTHMQHHPTHLHHLTSSSQSHSSQLQSSQVFNSHSQSSHSQTISYSQSQSHSSHPQSTQHHPSHSQPSPQPPSHPQSHMSHTVTQSHSSHSQSKTQQSALSHSIPSHPPPSYQASPSSHQQPPPSYSQSTQPFPTHSQPSPSPVQPYPQPPLPSYTQATMSHLAHHQPPPPYHPPPRQPHPPRPDIPYRHPPPVARVGPVSRGEGSDGHAPTPSLASHLASRTPQQQSLAEQLKALLAEREVESEGGGVMRVDRDVSPSKRSPTSLIEDVRQAVMQADVSLGKKPMISGPLHVSSTALHHHHHHHHITSSSSSTSIAHHNTTTTTTSSSTTSSAISAVSPQRAGSAFYPPAGRESLRERDGGRESGKVSSPPSPKPSRTSTPHHPSPAVVSPNPSGVVLLSQRPLDPSSHKMSTGLGEGGGGGSSGDLSSGPASLGSGDEGSGASLGGSQTSLTGTDRSRRAHMWQTAPVVDWTKEQVGQWLVVQGLEGCVGRFLEVGMTGPRLLNLDLRDLKSLQLPPDDRTRLKRKVKELRLAVEKERKQVEKEKKEREKLQKKAEKLAEKAERKKK